MSLPVAAEPDSRPVAGWSATWTRNVTWPALLMWGEMLLNADPGGRL